MRQRRRRVEVAVTIAVALGLAAPGCMTGARRPTRVAADRHAPGDAVDQWMRAAMAKAHVPGAAIAVVRDGAIVKVGAYGVANLEDDAPVTEHTRFHLDSTSKLFTAIAIMQLVEQGKLTLDDPVSRWLADVQPAWSGITIRHLLTHSSGIVDDYAEELHGSMLVDYPPEVLYEHARTRPLEFAPGTTTRYNNLGFYLLTLVVERASGMPFPRYVEERIFRPLGMTESAWPDADQIVAHLAAPYAHRDGKLVHFRSYIVSNAGSSYLGATTARDLARVALAIDRGTLLTPASWSAMLQPFRLVDGSASQFGLAWELGLQRGHPTAGKGGGTGALIRRYLDRGLTVVVLGNLAGGPGLSYGELADGIAGLFDPVLARRLRPELGLDADAFASRLREVLSRVAAGEPDDHVNARWVSSISKDDRTQLAELLAHTVRLESLGCDAVAPGVEILGRPIARQCIARLSDAAGPLIELSVLLEQDGRVASIGPE
ncbi:MAG TPA: serine hydrolase domain-containing protein [Kofleriaceae bacterium]|nr:serine hydrolase domain-containing protein [Kofleriaceae bacterium]